MHRAAMQNKLRLNFYLFLFLFYSFSLDIKRRTDGLVNNQEMSRLQVHKSIDKSAVVDVHVIVYR